GKNFNTHVQKRTPGQPAARHARYSCLRARMRTEGPCNQAEATDQQDQHNKSVEEAGSLEIDVHVGDDAAKNEERARDGQKPADEATTVPEEQAHAEEHGHQRDAKRVCSVKIPVGTSHAHLICKEVAAQANHDESEHESAQPARRPAYIAYRS